MASMGPPTKQQGTPQPRNIDADNQTVDFDSTMTDAFGSDDDKTLKPYRSQDTRQWPALRLQENASDREIVHQTLRTLREYHLLHKRLGTLGCDDAGWDRPEMGMLGFSELPSLIGSLEICQANDTKPSAIMQKAYKAIQRREVAASVVDASDIVMRFPHQVDTNEGMIFV